MCAQVPSMNSAEEHKNPRRQRRERSGRHRLASGTIRVVEDDAGVWSLAPVNRPAHYVGRVGALAVALGVGGAIVGLPGVAAADSGGSAAADSTASTGSSARSGETAGTRRSRGATRADATRSSSDPSPGVESGSTSRTGRAATRRVSPEIPADLSVPPSRRGGAVPTAPASAAGRPNTSPAVGASAPVDNSADTPSVTGGDELSTSIPSEEIKPEAESGGAVGPAATVDHSATVVVASNEVGHDRGRVER